MRFHVSSGAAFDVTFCKFGVSPDAMSHQLQPLVAPQLEQT
jgi:hypothetical protein